ncbi:hypothetical protein [uncultured Eubacterium sp.]|uniref:hypothetical protein n=1 Tax=uncultured Eubacterium sp. TaxID=165185 RepID=UPI0026DC5441|nr:hypothetical protein [uncultured Eubacterium sp.]
MPPNQLSVEDNLQVLENKITQLKEKGEEIVNETLWNEGGKLIGDNAKGLIHPSGRRWKGKATASTSTEPFTQRKSNLAITVVTKNKYHYLYFPDDGSNTKKHAGEQHFMLRGLNNSSGEITQRCLAKLTAEIEK